MKKNIALIILLLLVIGLAGYLGYDKFLKKEEPAKNENTTEKEETKDVTTNNNVSFKVENKGATQNFYTYRPFGTHIVVDKNGEAYIEILDLNDDDEEIKNNKNELKKQYKEYTINGYNAGAEECDLGKSNTFKGIKLPVNNVIAVYETDDGQDSMSATILLLKADGTISGFQLYDFINRSTELINKGTFDFKEKIGNLENIVSIVRSQTLPACGSASNETYAIDNTGKYHIVEINW